MMKQPEVLLPRVAAGVRAGALDAIRKARLTGTKLVVWLDGKIVEITPDEADAMLKEQEEQKARQ